MKYSIEQNGVQFLTEQNSFDEVRDYAYRTLYLEKSLLNHGQFKMHNLDVPNDNGLPHMGFIRAKDPNIINLREIDLMEIPDGKYCVNGITNDPYFQIRNHKVILKNGNIRELSELRAHYHSIIRMIDID